MIPAWNNVTSTDDWMRFTLKNSAHITLYNNNALNTVEFSFDGINQHGVIPPNVGFTLPDVNADTIYFKSLVAGAAGVIFCWGTGERNVVYPPLQADRSQDINKRPSSFVSL